MFSFCYSFPRFFVFIYFVYDQMQQDLLQHLSAVKWHAHIFFWDHHLIYFLELFHEDHQEATANIALLWNQDIRIPLFLMDYIQIISEFLFSQLLLYSSFLIYSSSVSHFFYEVYHLFMFAYFYFLFLFAPSDIWQFWFFLSRGIHLHLFSTVFCDKFVL